MDLIKTYLFRGPGDPEGFLFRGFRAADGTRVGQNADQDEIIAKLQVSGANCIYIQAIRSDGGDGGDDHNPFNDPSDPTSGLNDAILDQWEGWFNAMDQMDIVIFLFLYDDSFQTVWRQKSRHQ